VSAGAKNLLALPKTGPKKIVQDFTQKDVPQKSDTAAFAVFAE